MRALASISISITFAVAACGGSSNNGTDAGPPDGAGAGIDAPVDAPPGGPFDCAGQPLPTTAPASITVTGSTQSITLGGRAAVSGTMVTAYKNGSGTALGSATSDTQGAYSLNLSTGGTPIDGYLLGHRGTAGSINYIDTYLYPPAPLATSTDKGSILLLSSGNSGTFSTLQSFAGVTQNAGSGFIAVIVADCNNNPLAGATVTTTPMGTVKYNSGGIPSGSATMTGSDGLAYVFNTVAGTVNVQATSGAHTLRAHDVNARADVITTTAIQP
jgi:hypothetical protein